MFLSTSNLESLEDKQVVRDLKKLLSKRNMNRDFILFKMDNTKKEAKINLRRVISKNPDCLLILCSFNPKVLAFSSGARVFHSVNLLDWKYSLRGLQYKLNLLRPADEIETIPIYYNDKTINIKHTNICCIKGSGNYCYFYVHDQKEFLVTMRIKEVREKLEDSDMFFDVNRSIIVNINRVASISKQSISFRSRPKYMLNLGYRSIKRVKDELLWNNK